jgi:hypothetical protein
MRKRGRKEDGKKVVINKDRTWKTASGVAEEAYGRKGIG